MIMEYEKEKALVVWNALNLLTTVPVDSNVELWTMIL
jgi:hypothetical protein